MAYNRITLRKPVGIVLSLLFLAALATPLRSWAQQQGGTARSSHLLLILPFENTSSAPATDWISEAFPEVLGNRLSAPSLFIMTRDDRLSAFDRLGVPAGAKPSRATIYQIAQQLDADYVLMGDYRVEGQILTAHARLMNVEKLHLSPEMTESGPLPNLLAIQAAVAWDVMSFLSPGTGAAKTEFVGKFPAQHLDAFENYIRGILATNQQEKIKRFKEAVRLDPAYTAALLQLGKGYYSARDYESAVTWLAKVPQNDANANEAQFFLGMAAFYGGHMDRAENAFRSVSSRLPLTEVYNNLGVVAARRSDRRARGYFQRCVETDPNEPDYRFNLAVELYREGETQSAVHELRQQLAISPDGEARSFLDSLVTGPPPARLPLERIKRNYDESGFRQLELEIENMNEARLEKSDPASHAAFHVQRGLELLDSGLPGEADKQFREAVVLDPTNADAHTGLARSLEAAQDMAGARNEARMSLKLKPTADAYLVLARLDLAENKSSAAAQDVEHALALDPGNAAALALKHDIAAGKQQSPQP